MKRLTPTELLKTVKKHTWFIQGFNGLPLYLHAVASSTGWMTQKDFGANYHHFFLRDIEGRAHWYYDEIDMHNVGEGYYKRVKNIKQLQALEKKYNLEFQKQKIRTKLIPSHELVQLSVKELMSLGERVIKELTSSVGIAHALEGISFTSEARLKTILEKRQMNTPDNYQLLSAPVKFSFISEAQMLLGRIKKSKGARKESLVKQFLTDFDWIDNSYVRGKLLTEKEVLQKVKEVKHSTQNMNGTIAKKAKLIKLLRLSREELFVIHTVEFCTKWQDNRKKHIMQTVGRCEPVVIELAKRLGISTDNLKYATPYEFNGKQLSKKGFITELKNRLPGSAYYTHAQGIDTYSQKEYAFLEKGLVQIESGGVTEITGTIASSGKVRGRVKVCRSIHDILKVKKGEILVTFMTRPEFLPAMQKAAAFVTNEGGITSHAAIVAREMKKPCIIGTKIATQVFKDGDMVEVDANKGVVRKI